MPHASTDPESSPASLSGLPDEARSRALARFQVIRPFLEDGVPLTQIAREQGIILRTARRWVDRYRRGGLTGLARKERGDKGQRKLTPALRQLIEGLALRKPRMPTATIHREVADAARKMGQEPPSYKVVRAVVGELASARDNAARRLAGRRRGGRGDHPDHGRELPAAAPAADADRAHRGDQPTKIR